MIKSRNTNHSISNEQSFFEKEFKKQLKKVEAVSFDIFDTLIHRSVARPVDVFKIVEVEVNWKSLSQKFANTSFQALRVQAEKHARARARSVRSSEEVNINEIYDALRELVDVPEKTAQHLKDTEISIERRVVYQNPLIHKLVEASITAGKKVILCSDMYLPKDVIRDLVHTAGYPDIPLLVSCDVGMSKHEGTIFEFVSKTLDVPLGKILHVGDNSHADFKMASKAGVLALHFNLYEKLFSHHSKAGWQPDSDWGSSSIARSFLKGQTIKQRIKDPDNALWGNAGFCTGVDIFGPYMAGKATWIHNAIALHKIDSLLFFARDAQLDLRVFQEMFGNAAHNFETHYVYTSRAAILHASFVDFSLDKVWSLISGRKTKKSVASWLESVGIHSAWMHIDPIRRSGFSAPTDQVYGGDQRLYNLVCKLYDVVLDNAREARNAALQYFRPFVEKKNVLGIVDVGWNGNLQAAFEKLIRTINPDVKIIGLYSGTLAGAQSKINERSKINGFFCENGTPSNFSDAILSGGSEILEFVHSADHGTTLGYTLKNNAVSPVIQEVAPNATGAKQVYSLQAGIISFCKGLKSDVEKFPLLKLNGDDWSNDVLRLITKPTVAEADYFGEIEHSESVGEILTSTKIAQKLHGIHKVKFSKRYRTAKKMAFWSAGFKTRNSFRKG